MEFISGQRVGGYLVFRDGDGLRHAVRVGTVLALSDADESQTSTVVQLPGGRALMVGIPMDEILGWLDRPSPSPR